MKQLAKTDIFTRMLITIEEHDLLSGDNACLLMVSGGSDSTALAYLASELRTAKKIGPLAMLHVDHKLRGDASRKDAQFASELAALLDIPFFLCEIDIAKEAAQSGENVEAVARRERYLAANEALMSLCQHTGTPFSDGRILTAHTSDDRIENFYMRSIVGTGPGGFRSMLYKNGPVVRPLLDVSREDLRGYIAKRQQDDFAVATDDTGALWREDATNAHTDRFRAYVRHEIVPKAKQWNEQMSANLIRTMNLIADEDDMIDEMASAVMKKDVSPLWAADKAAARSADDAADKAADGVVGKASNEATDGAADKAAANTANEAADDVANTATANTANKEAQKNESNSSPFWTEADYANGFLLKPSFGYAYKPLQRRVVHKLLKLMLGADERIDASSVEAVLSGFETIKSNITAADENAEAVSDENVDNAETCVVRPIGGYVANIQGDLAVSSNKLGVRVEPMDEFRKRRKKK